MFEEIFFPRTAERYRAAPLVEQCELYLVHLRKTGARRATLRKCAHDQLSLMRLLKLKDGSRVRLSDIEAVTAVWSQPKARGAIGRHHPRREHAFSGAEYNGCASWDGSMNPNMSTMRITERSRSLRSGCARSAAFPRRPYKTTAAPPTASSSGWQAKTNRWTPSR
jgi:hypothetical protein